MIICTAIYSRCIHIPPSVNGADQLTEMVNGSGLILMKSWGTPGAGEREGGREGGREVMSNIMITNMNHHVRSCGK